jgi:hypothetical protein
LDIALQKCLDDETKPHAAHITVLPLDTQFPPPSTVSSSLVTTPFASTLGSRSTSQSSETGSLPITPAELTTSIDRSNTEQALGPSIPSSQVPVSHATPFDSHKISATGDTEDHLSRMEELVDLYLLSHHGRQDAGDAASSTDPQDKSFSDGFLEQLFEEGEAAKRLVELQHRLPEGEKLHSMP